MHIFILLLSLDEGRDGGITSLDVGSEAQRGLCLAEATQTPKGCLQALLLTLHELTFQSGRPASPVL